jgi:hypothetical protein
MQLDYYTLQDEGGLPDNRLEAMHACVESDAAEALTRFLANPEAVTAGDRTTLSYFLALLTTPTPGAVEESTRISTSGMRLGITLDIAHFDVFARKYREDFPDESDAQLREMHSALMGALQRDELVWSDPKVAGFQVSFGATDQLARIIFLMHWDLLCATSGGLVTSDRAIALVDPTPRFPWPGLAWGSSPTVEGSIPLGLDRCLYLTYDETGVHRYDVERDAVQMINLRTYGWATEYIYGSSQEHVVEVRQAAKREPTGIARPREGHSPALLERDPTDDSLAQENQRRGWPPTSISRCPARLHRDWCRRASDRSTSKSGPSHEAACRTLTRTGRYPDCHCGSSEGLYLLSPADTHGRLPCDRFCGVSPLHLPDRPREDGGLRQSRPRRSPATARTSKPLGQGMPRARLERTRWIGCVPLRWSSSDAAESLPIRPSVHCTFWAGTTVPDQNGQSISRPAVPGCVPLAAPRASKSLHIRLLH